MFGKFSWALCSTTNSRLKVHSSLRRTSQVSWVYCLNNIFTSKKQEQFSRHKCKTLMSQHIIYFCFVEIVTTSQSINELNYFPNCDTLQARQPFGNYSVLLYLYFTVIIFLIRLLCVTYRFRTTLTKNKQQFETHGFGCVSQQNNFIVGMWSHLQGSRKCRHFYWA